MNNFKTVVNVLQVTSYEQLIKLLKDDDWQVKIAIDGEDEVGHCKLSKDGVVDVVYANGTHCDYLTAECDDYFYSFEIVAVKKTTTYLDNGSPYCDTTAMARYLRSIIC